MPWNTDLENEVDPMWELARLRSFSRQLESDVIRQPFDIGITTGSYWLTRLQSRAETSAMLAFKGWLREMATQG